MLCRDGSRALDAAMFERPRFEAHRFKLDAVRDFDMRDAWFCRNPQGAQRVPELLK
jgi:hypothetical protein